MLNAVRLDLKRAQHPHLTFILLLYVHTITPSKRHETLSPSRNIPRSIIVPTLRSVAQQYNIIMTQAHRTRHVIITRYYC